MYSYFACMHVCKLYAFTDNNTQTASRTNYRRSSRRNLNLKVGVMDALISFPLSLSPLPIKFDLLLLHLTTSLTHSFLYWIDTLLLLLQQPCNPLFIDLSLARPTSIAHPNARQLELRRSCPLLFQHLRLLLQHLRLLLHYLPRGRHQRRDPTPLPEHQNQNWYCFCSVLTLAMLVSFGLSVCGETVRLTFKNVTLGFLVVVWSTSV